MTVTIIFATMEACSFTPRSSYRANSRYTFTIFPTTRRSKLQRINSRGTYVMRAFYGRNNFQSTSSCRLQPHEITLVSRRRECPRYSGTRESQRIFPHYYLARSLSLTIRARRGFDDDSSVSPALHDERLESSRHRRNINERASEKLPFGFNESLASQRC